MKSFTCTNIAKGTNNKVLSYEIQDSTGKIIQVSYNKLKSMLENNKIEVVNLIIENNKIVEDPDYQIKNMLAKLQLFGKPYKSACGHDYYVLKNSDTTIVYIPDDVKYLIKTGDGLGRSNFCNINCKLLKVIGGLGLTSTYSMFYDCKAQSIDLSSLNTSKVCDMSCMFYACKAQSLDLSSFNTSNVTNMEWMFFGCGAQSLDLSSFDTSNVTDMRGMLYACKAQSLDFSSFDTSKVTNMKEMFSKCKARSLDLSSFDTSKVINMENMFDGCKAQVKVTGRQILDELNWQ